MKMKKSTWLLLVLALAAILLVAGCEPTTPTPTPPENGEEPPPTPPGDTAAPKVVKTMVSNAATATFPDRFKITIVFDEDIYSPCAENPNNWTVRVVNSQRREGNRNILTPPQTIQIVGNQIILYARVAEFGAPVITYELVSRGTFVLTPAPPPTTRAGWSAALQAGIDEVQAIVDAVNALSDVDKIAFLLNNNAEYYALLAALNDAKVALNATYADDAAAKKRMKSSLNDLDAAFQILGLRAVETGATTPTFAGLICSQEDADAYKAAFGIEVTAADVVTWGLSDDCAISDILGNSQCGYSDQACCVGPECEECVECDFTTGICK